VRAVAEFDQVGAAVLDADTPIIDAEFFGADLREDRLHALPNGAGAGHQFDTAGRVDRQPYEIGRAETGFFDEHRQAHTDGFPQHATFGQVGLQLLPSDARQCLVEQTGVVARIEDHIDTERVERPRVRHFGRRNQVAAPHFDNVDADAVRDRIHQPLTHEGCLIAAGRAVGRRRRFVDQPEMPRHFIRGHTIRSQQQPGGHVRHARAVRAHIRALRVEELVLDGENPAVRVHRGLDQMSLLARVIGRHQVLATILDPLDRPAQAQCRKANEHVLGVQLASYAEAAAHMPFVEVHG
jgi:hypothetical protein